MNNGVSISGDITRKLQTKPFTEGSTISIDIPRDSVFKALSLRLIGAIQTTYGSGTPVAENRSTMGTLINYIDIVSNGSFTIKNVTPWMMRMQDYISTGQFGERRASAAASAVSPAEGVSADSKFVYGTTTQYTSVVESILIPFFNTLASDGMDTIWDTRGLASAEMKISTNSFSGGLLGFGNTAPVVYANSTMQLVTETIECANIPNNAYFSAFKQTTKQKAFTAQTNDELIDINRGNYLQGLLLEAHDGASGSSTTATGKMLSNTLLTDLKLIVNGSLYVQNTNFGQLQAKNKARYGIYAPYAANISQFDGMAYIDLLVPSQGSKFGSIKTAQNVQAPNVDSCQLAVSTSSAATYTSTAYMNIMTNEIVPPLAKA